MHGGGARGERGVYSVACNGRSCNVTNTTMCSGVRVCRQIEHPGVGLKKTAPKCPGWSTLFEIDPARY